MLRVEHLLARLLDVWEVDVYVRLAASGEPPSLEPIFWAGLRSEEADVLAASPLVTSHANQALLSLAPVVVNDLESRDTASPHLTAMNLRALVVMPLGPDSSPSGVALFGSREATVLSESTLTLLRGFSDIVTSYASEQDQTTEQMRRLVVQLTEAENRERTRIASLLHDDLQQTIAGIKVHVDMAARRATTDTHVVERLTTASKLIDRVIEQSRSLSHELSPPMLKRRGLVSALKMLASEMQRIHRLDVSIDDRTGSIALGELASLVMYRAVQELLFNIVKHAGVNAATVTVDAVEEGLRIIVRDHGQGFDVQDVVKRDTPAGLGLVSLRERIEAIGGMLEIVSARGAGSTFTIFLPPAAMATEGTLAARASNAADEAAVDQKLSILLVDDHAVIRQGLAYLLNEEPDLEVVGEADDGDAAIDLARKLLPDVIVMDLGMPGMTGDEATREILEFAPLTRIVGLSMYAEHEARERMLDAGAVAYLPKAGPSSDLIAAIRGDDDDSRR